MEVWRLRNRNLLLIVVVVGVMLFVLLQVRFGVIVWEGAFLQAEYEFVFVNENGEPLEGVELRVRNKAGSLCYNYPITDYHPGNKPISDKNGILRFHHCSTFPEFSTRSGYIAFVIPFREGEVPAFNCEFIFRGRMIYSLIFNSLNAELTTSLGNTWEDSVRVRRQISLPNEYPDSFPEHMRLKENDNPKPMEFLLHRRIVKPGSKV